MPPNLGCKADTMGLGIFFIEIGYSRDKTGLQVAYMGRKADTFTHLM